MRSRACVFVGVGAAGFAVQLVTLHALIGVYSVPIWAASVAAVECAVVTNFAAHARWTWRDRMRERDDTSRGAWTWWTAFVRFHGLAACTSLVFTPLLTLWLANVTGVGPLVANTAAVVVLAGFNYVGADRWVFRAPYVALALVFWLCGGQSTLRASGLETDRLPTPRAVAAWSVYEAQAASHFLQAPRRPPLSEPQGRRRQVDDALIHEWRGTVTIPGVSVDDVVDVLRDPRRLPPQEDIVSVRLIRADGDDVSFAMRMTRRLLVSATYDTEHEVHYTRLSRERATSRSRATRIVEVGGSDRGFLWRLSSYWTYEQVGADVQVDVLSLSLSREMPWWLKPAAAPMVDRVGRESMMRTLQAARKAVEGSARPGGAVQDKGAPYSGAPLLLADLAPPAFTAPCRNQTSDGRCDRKRDAGDAMRGAVQPRHARGTRRPMFVAPVTRLARSREGGRFARRGAGADDRGLRAGAGRYPT